MGSRPFSGLANEQACEEARPQRPPDLRVRCTSATADRLILEPLGNEFDLSADPTLLLCWLGTSVTHELEADLVREGLVLYLDGMYYEVWQNDRLVECWGNLG